MQRAFKYFSLFLLLLILKKCNISVHQKCYGISDLPTEDWICDLCLEFGASGQYLKCPLCQQRGGALKKSQLTSETNLFLKLNPNYHQILSQSKMKKPEKKRGNNKYDDLYYDFQQIKKIDYAPENIIEPKITNVWAHVTCTLWIPETYFLDKINYNKVKGIENIDPKKFSSICCICNSSSKVLFNLLITVLFFSEFNFRHRSLCSMC